LLKLGDVYPVDSCAGGLTASMSKKTGLREGTAVCVGTIDAHVNVPAVGVTESGTMVMIMGTSLCHLVLCDDYVATPGACGVVKDGIIPGYYGLEAGQSAVGDIFDWYGSKIVCCDGEKDNSVLAELNVQSTSVKAGGSGLLALDWWNGNRSILGNSNLTGLVLGMNLSTTKEEIYHALIESTAYGTRMIMEELQAHGIEIKRIVACGGLPHRSSLIMQIFSDVLNRPIWVSAVQQTSALGAAMYGAVAAGSENGGYDTISEASIAMSRVIDTPYLPNKEAVPVYDQVFSNYKKLHQFFGVEHPEIMADLLQLKRNINGE